MHELAQRVLSHIQREELLHAGDRVGIAVSGGIDSVALLRLLIELRHELGLVLSVVHFNHKLRGAESDADQDFVASLAREHRLELHAASGDVAQFAAKEHSGVEAAARELRYAFLRRLLGSGEDSEEEIESAPQDRKPESIVDPNGTGETAPFPNPPLNKIATGHTLDDQAETVMMRLIRGTGMRGLAGIYPRILVEREDGESHAEIVRPLLGIRRRELEQYLKDIKQPWREDSTNGESEFTRNRLRKLVLPLLEREFNPSVVENLNELAQIARDEDDYWENEISGWLGTVVQWSEPEWARDYDPNYLHPVQTDLVQINLVQFEPAKGGKPTSPTIDSELQARIASAPWLVMNASLSRPWLLTEPKAVQRRVVKAIGEEAGVSLEFKHVEEILRFAAEDGPLGKELSLPLGWKVLREPEAMVFLTPDLREHKESSNYEYALPVPGSASIPQIGGVIEALRLHPDAAAGEYNPQQLLRTDLLPVELIVRNWRPGDRFWPAHTKTARKVKELLSEKHIGDPERKLWPVVANGDEIVWMRGFPVPARLRATADQEAVLIREISLLTDRVH